MKKKLTKIITTCFLTLILCLSFVLPNIISAKNQIATRNIDVKELGMMSYEEKAEQILNNFDNYDISKTETNIKFEASFDISTLDFSSIEFLSTEAKTTTKKFLTDLDLENEKFYVITQYIQDDIIVYEEKCETIPYYDDYLDDYFIQMPNGEMISVYDSINGNNLEECSITLTAIALGLTAKEAAVLLTAVVIVAAPAITYTVTKIVQTVVTWIRSFWSWFKSLWTAKTVTTVTTVTTATIAYTVSISGTKYDVKKYDKNKNYEEAKYYIAIADTVDGFLYVSDIAVDDTKALAILTTSTFVTGATRNKYGVFPQLVVSLYTPNGYDAYLIACAAGTILQNPGATHHIANKPGYFNHYHPGGIYQETSKPHVFYGQPI